MRPPRMVLWALILLGVAGGIVALLARVEAERGNRSVDVVLDYNGLVDFCKGEGVPLAQTLESFKKEGVTALAYPEATLDRLRDEGRLSYYGGADFEKALRAGLEAKPAGVTGIRDVRTDPGKVYVVIYDPQLLKELAVYLKLFLGTAPSLTTPPTDASPADGGSPVATPSPDETPAAQTGEPRFRIWPTDDALRDAGRGAPVVLEVSTSLRTVLDQGFGFTRSDLAVAEDAALHFYVRPESRARFTSQDIRAYMFILGKMMKRGAVGLIFSGGSNEIMGYPDLLDDTVDGMRKMGLLFGNIEVSTADAAQKGSQTLGNKLADRTVRVMSFSPAFQAKLTPPDVIDKFVLGVRERNIRVLYLRFFATPSQGQTLLQTNLEYVRKLKEGLEHAGFTVGAAEPFPSIAPPLWALALMALGIGAACVMVLGMFVEVPVTWELGTLLGAPALAAAFCVIGRWSFGAKLAALGAATVFPVLGIMLFLPRMVDLAKTESSPARSMLRAALWLIAITALTAAGGVYVAGLLAGTSFMLSVDQFRGIKLVMLVPPVLAVLYYMLRCAPQRRTLTEMIGSSVLWWQAAALVVLMGLGVFYIMRTGNTPVGGASEAEIGFRNLLEDLLVARPRFKEFALGHPAWVVLGLLAWEQRIVRFWWLFVLATAIGQADVVDTFAHIHTPYLISLLRVVNGLWLGILLGLLAGIAVLWMLWRGNRPAGARTSAP